MTSAGVSIVGKLEVQSEVVGGTARMLGLYGERAVVLKHSIDIYPGYKEAITQFSSTNLFALVLRVRTVVSVRYVAPHARSCPTGAQMAWWGTPATSYTRLRVYVSLSWRGRTTTAQSSTLNLTALVGPTLGL